MQTMTVDIHNMCSSICYSKVIGLLKILYRIANNWLCFILLKLESGDYLFIRENWFIL